jgi:hypothetical protein
VERWTALGIIAILSQYHYAARPLEVVMLDSSDPRSEYSGRGEIAEDLLSFRFEGTADEARTAMNEAALDMGLRVAPESQASISFKEPMSLMRRPVTLDVALEPKGKATQVRVLGSTVGSGSGQLTYIREVIRAFSSQVGAYAPDGAACSVHNRRRRALYWLGIGQVASVPLVVVPAALIPFVSRRGAFIAYAAWFCAFAVVSPTSEVIRRRSVGLGGREDLFFLVGCFIAAAAVLGFLLLALH